MNNVRSSRKIYGRIERNEKIYRGKKDQVCHVNTTTQIEGKIDGRREAHWGKRDRKKRTDNGGKDTQNNKDSRGGELDKKMAVVVWTLC